MKPARLLPALLASAGLLAAAAGCHRESAAQALDATTAPDPLVERVTAGPPARKTLALETVQPGRIEAFEQTPLYARLSGYVDEVLVDIGDSVAEGQVLVRLAVPELRDEQQQKQALVDQAGAEVKQAAAAVRAAEAGLATTRALVAQAEAGTARAESEYQRARSEHDRVSRLAESGSLSRKLLDEALEQYRSADAARSEASARIASAEAAVGEAEANVEKSQADAGAARARLKVAQADLARAQTMLAYTEIKAPFAGVVTRRTIDTGHFVQPAAAGSSAPLLVVARTDRVRVFVDVPETEAALVDKGDPATVAVQALRGRTIPGEVTRTAWALDAANRSLRTEIDLPNAEQQLRPGMYATARIRLEQRPDALVLPTTALVRESGETFVCRVESGRIARRPVQAGLRVGTDVEILSGLNSDETVVLTRAESLKEGQAVEIIPQETKAP